MADASETTDIGDRNTTLVPVVRILLLSDYAEKTLKCRIRSTVGGSQGEIEMVPLQREPPVAGPSSSSADMA